MKKLTNKQKSVAATIAAIIAGSVTPLVVTQMSPLPDYVNPHYAGAPASTNHWIYLTNRTYTVAYDPDTRNPAWVAYKVEWGGGGAAPKRPGKFKEDKRLPSPVSHKDYTNSGYDRGHMAPSYAIGVRYGKGGQRETFLMSNVIPQTPGLNQGPWRLLEEHVAKNWANEAPVWVVTGPLYDDAPDVIGPGIEVPDACWKVFIQKYSSNAPPRAVAFIIPQRVLRNDPYTDFVTSVDEVERRTGIDFFSELEDDSERIIEAGDTLW